MLHSHVWYFAFSANSYPDNQRNGRHIDTIDSISTSEYHAFGVTIAVVLTVTIEVDTLDARKVRRIET